MSDSSDFPVYTISVGSAGTYTNDASTNMAPLVNSEIAAAPAGSEIEITFEPGSYGVSSPIFLPSNTSVIGYGATITSVTPIYNQGIFVNKDAYNNGPWLQENLTDGSSYGLYTYSGNDTSGTSTEPPSVNAIIDTNISVQGMTLVLKGGWGFGTWFTNSQDIDVQNNTYIGGVDGNAFVNVVNGVVSNNIGIGQVNAAYDNWDGPVNISIQDNSAYMNGGWSVLMNSTPTGDPNNPGNAINDNITDNNFTTGVPNNLVLNANALLSYGFTYEKDITEQGNVMSLNYVPGNTAVYSADPMYGMIVQDNLVSGTNVIGASFTGAVYVVDSGANPITTPTIDGNLIVGSEASPGVSSVVVMGTMVSAFDNAVLGANLVSVATVSADNVAGTAIVGGNVASSGGIATGTPLAAKLSINSPPTLFVSECTQQSLSGLNISSGMSNDLINVTISAVFGSLSDLSDQGIASWSSDGIETITISGSMDQVNQELENINYESNTQGWDDSIEIQATDAYGFSATRFVPVIIETNGVQADDIQTLASQDFSSNGTLTYPGALTGGAIVASSGDSMIDMAGTISVVMLGSGDNTVIGGPNNGYISGGSGFNTLDLSGGGDITVAGGVGGLQVNATNGNDVIQPGAGGGTIDLGSGNSSVYGGLGQFTVTGGSGNVYLASLPEHSGNFSVSLGNGGGTIYALSGDDSIETQLDTSNVVYLGLGNSTVHSGGNDDIYTGAGNVTVDASGGGNDTVIGGTGSLFFIGGTGDTFIDPSGSTTVLGGSGNTTISGGQNVTVEIHFLAGTSRRLNLYASNPLVELSGYSTDPISSQYINNGTIFIGLSDGSDIMLPDLSQRMAIFDNGLLSLGEPGALNNEVIYNLDQNTGLEENMGPGALISSLIQNAPIGQNVLIVSTGLQCNGVISF